MNGSHPPELTDGTVGVTIKPAPVEPLNQRLRTPRVEKAAQPGFTLGSPQPRSRTGLHLTGQFETTISLCRFYYIELSDDGRDVARLTGSSSLLLFEGEGACPFGKTLTGQE